MILFALFTELNRERSGPTSLGSEHCSQTYMGNNGRSKLDPLSASGNILCAVQNQWKTDFEIVEDNCLLSR
jgi:hypothetical protein